jgi:PAS domain S-box-containing protein
VAADGMSTGVGTSAPTGISPEAASALLQSTSAFFLTADEMGLVQSMNPSMLRTLGYELDDVVGQDFIKNYVHEQSRETLVFYLQTQLDQKGVWLGEIQLVTRAGEPVDVEWHAQRIYAPDGSLDCCAAIGIDVTERRRTQRELSTLLEISASIVTTLDRQPLCELILDGLQSAVPYSGASIITQSDSGLRILAQRWPGYDGAGNLGYQVHLERMGEFSEAARRLEPLIVDDVWDDSPQARAWRNTVRELLETPPIPWIHSFLAVGMGVQGRMVGMLALSHVQAGYFTERHARLAQGVARQAGIAIENARLYDQAQSLAILEERQRIARELHDSVSQALYGIALGAKTARTLLERDPKQAIEAVDYVAGLAEAGLTEMRALIFELRPDTIEREGLVVALERQVQAVQAGHSLSVRAALGHEPDVAMEIKESIYRVAQEALQNVIKHAPGSNVTIALTNDGEGLLLEVRDDGPGFDSSRSYPGHLGLMSMHERATRHGGKLTIESGPGGTTVQARIPMESAVSR